MLTRIHARLFGSNESPIAVASDDTDPRSNHTLMFEDIKVYCEKQSDQLDMLDTKAGVVATTSTTLTAGFLALLNGVEGTIDSRSRHSRYGADTRGVARGGW
jgi:hypothetical protein